MAVEDIPQCALVVASQVVLVVLLVQVVLEEPSIHIRTGDICICKSSFPSSWNFQQL